MKILNSLFQQNYHYCFIEIVGWNDCKTILVWFKLFRSRTSFQLEEEASDTTNG